jgi:hypothetical protein
MPQLLYRLHQEGGGCTLPPDFLVDIIAEFLGGILDPDTFGGSRWNLAAILFLRFRVLLLLVDPQRPHVGSPT